MDDPILFSDVVSRTTLARRARKGEIQHIAPGVYTSEVRRTPTEVVSQHWRSIVAHQVPNAVLVDRSAVSGQPDDGHLFVDAGHGPRRRPLVLPGLSIHRRSGPGPLDGDVSIRPGLWLSSQARALADNTRRSRRSQYRPPATLDDRELAVWVDHLATVHRRQYLLQLRDQATALAVPTRTAGTVDQVERLIGAALGTQRVPSLSPALAARQAGQAYDHRRVELFDLLVGHLESLAPSPIPAPEHAAAAHLPFFESYFSNFIEGTVLTLDEAEDVMYGGHELATHPADGHDVAATHRLVADPAEAAAIPTDAEELVELLLLRHGVLMAARPDKQPGAFKERSNRVGSHEFVAPDLVIGTLTAGWNRLTALEEPFARAVAMMFIVAEVHPFDDGNGRIARLMMNAELSAAGETRIIIPPVYRGEYLTSLNALSANSRPDALPRVLAFAQRWTAQVDFSDLHRAEAIMRATNAFVDPAVAHDHAIKLRLPSSIPAAELG